MLDDASSSDEVSGGSAEDLQALSSCLLNYVTVVGEAFDATGNRIGYAITVNLDGRSLLCPGRITGRRKAAEMETWLIENGLDVVLDEMTPSDVGTQLRRLARGKSVIALNHHGYHLIARTGARYHAYVWQGKKYAFGDRPSEKVLLLEVASSANEPRGDAKDWCDAFSPIASRNPRLLVALSFALSSLLARRFGLPPFTLALVGPTSTGKSRIQMACSSMVGRPEVISWNATKVGVHDWLTDRPDQPCCVEDMHKADAFEDVSQTIMSVGNGARRIRAASTMRVTASLPLSCTLIASTEVDLLSHARSEGARVNEGVLARYFELHLGAFGMFDNLCGQDDGAALADEIERLSNENYGALWPQWAHLIAANWERVEKWHFDKVQKIRAEILDEVGNPSLDALTGRVVKRLTFAAFAGRVASELGLWRISGNDLASAFGLMLKEHLVRRDEPTASAAATLVENVRNYIETYRGRFPQLAPANDMTVPSGISGHVHDHNRHGRLFLFFRGTFDKLFVQKHGEAVYRALAEGGYLVTQPERGHRLLVDLPTRRGEPRLRKDFIAIRAEILARDGS